MDLMLLKSKVHRATVTGASLHYEGSLTISSDLATLVGLHEYEKILVGNLNNGARFETYVIYGEPRHGRIELNGCDRIIVAPLGSCNQITVRSLVDVVTSLVAFRLAYELCVVEQIFGAHVLLFLFWEASNAVLSQAKSATDSIALYRARVNLEPPALCAGLTSYRAARSGTNGVDDLDKPSIHSVFLSPLKRPSSRLVQAELLAPT